MKLLNDHSVGRDKRIHFDSRTRFVAGVIDQLSASAGNFLLIIVCAIHLPGDELGKLAYTISFSIAARTLLRLAVLQTLFVVAPYEDKQRYGEAMILLAALVAIGSGMFSAGATVVFASISSAGWSVGWQEFFAIICFVSSSALFDYQRAAKHVFSTAVHAALLSLVVFSGRALVLHVSAPSSYINAILLSALVFLPAHILIIPTLVSSTIKCKDSIRLFRSHASKSRHLISSFPGYMLRNQSPVFLLGELSGLVSSGLYIVARSVVNLGNIGLEFLGTYISNLLGRIHARDAGAYLVLHTRVLIVGVFAWLLGFLVLTFQDGIVLIKAGMTVQAGLVPLIVVLWCSMLFIFIERSLGIHLRQNNETKILGWVQYVGAFFTITLTLLLVPFLGLIGAGYGVLGGAVVVCGLLGYKVFFFNKMRIRSCE